MRIHSLQITDLRNLEHCAVELGDVSLFVGPNGSGKTSVLEAVHLLAHGRSFRSGGASTLIRKGSDEVVVRAEVETAAGRLVPVGLSRRRTGATSLRIDGSDAQRISDAARLLPVQTLLPTVSELVFGPPSLRRAWLDWGLFHVKPDYFVTLRKFQRVSAQRNSILRSSDSDRVVEKALQAWDQQYVELAQTISDARRHYVESLERSIVMSLSELTGGLTVDVHYRQGWNRDQSLADSLVMARPQEVKSRVCRVGPHRADVELRCEGQLATSTLSRGQGKVAASLMKLLQAEHVSQQTGRPTILLVDDFSAELDGEHAGRVFERLTRHQGQILVTATDEKRARWQGDQPGERERVFHVEHGRVSPAP